eukprot:TRINITY_DN10739_c0_g1_i3.p1 TRINITY_DN10739_c0_g1~~TRINITY_DN10739_c0_g1_i3.p1  ORF type:complete len:475 (+),score=41.65 TRINITY_DN10739_c0_g1_i3:49-1473(+)
MATELGERERRVDVPSCRPQLTTKVLVVLSVINLIDSINATLLMPYVESMVSGFLGKIRGDPDVSMWVEVLVGSYALCEVAFSYFWGWLSDRVGRRPVLLAGMVGSAVAPICFGMAQSLPMALAARILDGFFCGNVGVTRTYLGELVDASNEAWGFGCLASTFMVGMFIGPILGGLLAEPSHMAPSIFQGTVFEVYPYLLPNLTYAVFAIVAFVVGCVSLEETRPPRTIARSRRPARPGELLLSASDDVGARVLPKFAGLGKLLTALALLSGYTTARLQAFILVGSLPQSMDGFALKPFEIGAIQSLAAFVGLVNQTCLFTWAVRRFGPHRCVLMGIAETILLTLPWPAYGLLADPDRFGWFRYAPLFIFQCLSSIGFGFAWALIFLLINRCCDEHNRGATNGLANSLRALTAGLFPFATGALVQYGCRAEASGLLWGRYLAFFVNLLPGFIVMGLVAKQRAENPPSVVIETSQ